MEIILLLLGSALTIVGGYISNRHTTKLARDEAKKALLREKIEEIGALAVAAAEWADNRLRFEFTTPNNDRSPDPMDQLLLLVELYVPEVHLEAAELNCAVKDFSSFATSQGFRWAKLKESGVQVDEFELDEKSAAEVNEIYPRVLAKRGNLVRALGNVAREKTS